MKRLYKLIARIMGENVNAINEQSSPETLKNWDSFNGLLLLDALEKEFDVKFGIEEVVDVKNVADIKRHLKKHGVKIDG